MTRFFRGRPTVFFAMLCAAAMTQESVAGASASLEDSALQSGAGQAYPNALENRGDRATASKSAAALAVADTLIALRNRTCYSSGEALPTARALLADGPELPTGSPDGSFSVRGFARDGWPIVVDFKPQPGTVTQMDVTVASGGRQLTRTIILDPDGSRGRQLLKVEAPATGARTPSPAIYVISSVPIAALNVEHPGVVAAAPLQVFGMGGGPRAVGSVAIEQLAFNRANVGARFRFVAKSEFSQVRAQVQRLARQGDRTVIAPVFDSRQANLNVGRHGGDWPGTAAGTAGPSRGPHRLQVTGWFTTDDRSWVAALAPDIVVQ